MCFNKPKIKKENVSIFRKNLEIEFESLAIGFLLPFHTPVFISTQTQYNTKRKKSINCTTKPSKSFPFTFLLYTYQYKCQRNIYCRILFIHRYFGSDMVYSHAHNDTNENNNDKKTK